MLILYSHILIQLRDTTKRIKSARKREMDYKENTVTICHVYTGNCPSFYQMALNNTRCMRQNMLIC